MNQPIAYQKKHTRVGLLPADHFSAPYDWTHSHEGNVNPVLHARFDWFTSFDGFAKPFDWSNSAQSTVILNEVTGWLLAKASGLPCAERAFFIQVPAVALPPYSGEMPLPTPDKNGYVLCFVTEAIANHAVRGIRTTEMLVTEQSQWAFNDQTIAFDEGAGNSDRHAFNLVRKAAKDFALIDHGYLLRTAGLAYPSYWEDGALESMVGTSYDNKLHHNTYTFLGRTSPTVCQAGCERGMIFANTLRDALRRSMFEISFWCNKLVPGSSAKWLHFLHTRMQSEAMAELLHRRFGTIALHARPSA